MSDEKKVYNLTPEGSLGILALGDVGIEKWREVIAQKEKEEDSNNTTATDGEETSE